jgi:nitronate monooxygenase
MWKTPLAERLGIRFPIVQGPFGGGYSSVDLVVAVSEAGGLGSFGAQLLTPQEIAEVCAQICGRTRAPFALNVWVPIAGQDDQALRGAPFEQHVARLGPYLREFGLPDPERPAALVPAFDAQLDALLEAAPPVVSFVMGAPPAEFVREAHKRRIALLATASTPDEAALLEQVGVDAVVASGSDAGGHRGSFLRPVEESLIGTFSLIPQVADRVKIPVVAAGGIADGRGVLAALALGAHGVQVGTAFLASHESAAPEAHKQALVSPEAVTTVLTRVFSGRLARGILNDFIRELSPFESQIPLYPLQNWLTRPLRRAASAAGRGDRLALWSGQSAALVRRRPAAEVLRLLIADAERARSRLGTA